MLLRSDGFPLADNQGGVMEINVTSAGNIVYQNSASLPITWRQFLQGVTNYDYPVSTPNRLSSAIACTATTVTIGINTDTGGTKNMRYIVMGMA